MDNLRELLVLRNLRGFGKRKTNRIIEAYKQIYSKEHKKDFDIYIRELLSNNLYETAYEEVSIAEEKAERVVRWISDNEDISAITCFDGEYPEKLRDLGYDAPLILYVRTKKNMDEKVRSRNIFEVLNGRNFAVVGSRWPEEHIFKNIPAILTDAAVFSDRVIISGLARGCDSIGHRAALAAGVRTAAIIASGPDIITPEINYDLAMDILDTDGIVVTEYDPGTQAEEFRYLERDCITAALSDGVLVLECGIRSGTMKTVEKALELGRPVGCICDEGIQNLSDGCLHIINNLNGVNIDSLAALRKFLMSIPDASERSFFNLVKWSQQISFF